MVDDGFAWLNHIPFFQSYNGIYFEHSTGWSYVSQKYRIFIYSYDQSGPSGNAPPSSYVEKFHLLEFQSILDYYLYKNVYFYNKFNKVKDFKRFQYIMRTKYSQQLLAC